METEMPRVIQWSPLQTLAWMQVRRAVITTYKFRGSEWIVCLCLIQDLDLMLLIVRRCIQILWGSNHILLLGARVPSLQIQKVWIRNAQTIFSFARDKFWQCSGAI